MEFKIESMKVALGGAITAILSVLGVNYKLVILFIIAIIIDTLLGWAKAIKRSEWKSERARWGIVSKLVELLLIVLMYVCEWAFDVHWLINGVTTYFLICEGASILENIVDGDLNNNVPAQLVDILKKSKNNFVNISVEKFKKMMGGDTNE